MIESDGVVVSVESGETWVETQRHTACGHCQSSGSCGTSLLAKVFGQQSSRIKARNPIHATVGDQVVLGLPERLMLVGALQLYLFPLIGLFVGAWLGQTLLPHWIGGGEEPWAILGGLLGLSAILLLHRRLSPLERQAQVVILRRKSPSQTVAFPQFEDQKEKR